MLNGTLIPGFVVVIYQWLLLFQEFDFEIVMKPGQLNTCPNHLYHFETKEEPTNIDDGFPNAQLFRVDIKNDHYAPIIHFLATSVSLEDMLTS